jgi:hypothetical protein
VPGRAAWLTARGGRVLGRKEPRTNSQPGYAATRPVPGRRQRAGGRAWTGGGTQRWQQASPAPRRRNLRTANLACRGVDSGPPRQTSVEVVR